MLDAVIYVTGSRVREERQVALLAEHAWLDAHASELAWCRRVSAFLPGKPDRWTAVLVRASRQVLATVPLPLFAVDIPELIPRRMRAAIVRDVAYDRHGAIVRGMSHFAPGSVVYVAGPYSGDGYARTVMVGRDRTTARYVALIGPTARLKQWHVAEVSDPEALFVLDHAGGNWTWSEGIGARGLPDAPPPIAWRPLEAWEPLVRRWLEPERPELPSRAAAVLDCEVDQARAWLAQGTLGAELTRAQLGRYRPGTPAVVRSAATAWRALAPPAWQAPDAPRAFARPDLSPARASRTMLPTRPTPGQLHAAVVFCSAPETIATVEALATELAALLPPPEAVPPCPTSGMVWHFVRRSEVGQYLALDMHGEALDRRAVSQPSPRRAMTDALRAMTLAISQDDDLAAHDLKDRFDRGAAPGPGALLVEIIARGHALIDVTDDGTPHLVCPLLPAVASRRSHQA